MYCTKPLPGCSGYGHWKSKMLRMGGPLQGSGRRHDGIDDFIWSHNQRRASRSGRCEDTSPVTPTRGREQSVDDGRAADFMTCR